MWWVDSNTLAKLGGGSKVGRVVGYDSGRRNSVLECVYSVYEAARFGS